MHAHMPARMHAHTCTHMHTHTHTHTRWKRTVIYFLTTVQNKVQIFSTEVFDLAIDKQLWLSDNEKIKEISWFCIDSFSVMCTRFCIALFKKWSFEPLVCFDLISFRSWLDAPSCLIRRGSHHLHICFFSNFLSHGKKVICCRCGDYIVWL